MTNTTSVPQVGCEGDDGLLRIHAETETCDVCQQAMEPAARTEAAPLVSDDVNAQLLSLLKKARTGLANGWWDYGPGQDEHTKCNLLLEEIDAALLKIEPDSLESCAFCGLRTPTPCDSPPPAMCDTLNEHLLKGQSEPNNDSSQP